MATDDVTPIWNALDTTDCNAAELLVPALNEIVYQHYAQLYQGRLV